MKRYCIKLLRYAGPESAPDEAGEGGTKEEAGGASSNGSHSDGDERIKPKDSFRRVKDG